MKNDNIALHLQMIQGIITRMGQNSFHIKGWSVLIMVAIFTFASEQSNIKSILFTIIPLTIMWFLDSYYLLLEKKFRILYDDIAKKNKTNFSMNFLKVKLEIKDIKQICFVKVLFSVTEFTFYATCIITTVLIYFFA